MPDLLVKAAGERLIGNAYWDDFNKTFWQINDGDFWKLERLQTFREPSDASWVAFDKGNWGESLRLLEARRSSLQQHYRRITEAGFHTWRVRVVELPLNSYLQWEFHLLRLRNELGGTVRVIDSTKVEQFERSSLLPELITLGNAVMYDLLYDRTGLQEGGVRYVVPEEVPRYSEFIRRLFEQGEELESFFEREVAVLGPPTSR